MWVQIPPALPPLKYRQMNNKESSFLNIFIPLLVVLFIVSGIGYLHMRSASKKVIWEDRQQVS